MTFSVRALTVLLRLAATMLVASAALPGHAASVRPIQLDEIIDKSAAAFHGRCVANWSERDPSGVVATYTRFEVIDRLKGHTESTHVIKQIGGSLPAEDLQYKVEGIPTFNVGEEYVVFLHGVSRIGFSSPVGLGQGRFGVRQGETGRVVGNGADFRTLTANIPTSQIPDRARNRMQQAGAPVRQLDIDDFKQMVRARAGGGQ